MTLIVSGVYPGGASVSIYLSCDHGLVAQCLLPTSLPDTPLTGHRAVFVSEQAGES